MVYIPICKLFRVLFTLSHNPLDRPVAVWYAVTVLDPWMQLQEVHWWCRRCLVFPYGILIM